ncbi:MAG: DUF3102 domain-containing protein [Clostridia bacterium]|nr:DUF3102 domain-containing protein [Clostridia bacterium]
MDNTLTETKMELDVLRAKDLHLRIIDSGARAADAYCEMCRNLKMMRDGGYYIYLGYESFEEYTAKELGFKTRQAYNYIQQYEKLGEPFLQSNAKLGVTKLSLLVSIPALERDDFVEKNDLAGMSVSEVKKLVAENDRRGEQLTLLSDQIADKDAVIVDKSKSLSAAQKTIHDLMERLEAERSKPVEATLDNSEEIENLKNKIKELENREQKEKLVEDIETREENRRLKEQQEQMNQEIKRLTDKVCELQEKSVDTTPVVDPKELFRIHYKNAISAFNTLLEFIERQEDSNFYFEKTEAMVSLLNEKLKMLNVEETKCQ